MNDGTLEVSFDGEVFAPQQGSFEELPPGGKAVTLAVNVAIIVMSMIAAMWM